MSKALTIYRRLIADGHCVSLKDGRFRVTLCKPMRQATRDRLTAHAGDLVALLTTQPGRWQGEDLIHKLFTRAEKAPRP